MSDYTPLHRSIPAADTYVYNSHERDGVICTAVTGLVSLTAILFLLTVKTPKPKTYHRTHLFGYLMSLLLANTLQAIGTVMGLKWVVRNEITYGGFCSAQGGIKHAGNISTALWSFVIAMHLFNLLFLRSGSVELVFWITVIAGWAIVGMIVIIGPTVIQKPEDGPYFGISGLWCWITSGYPREQIFLEYFFEFASAGLSIILYGIVILRVRGNLAHTNGRWRLQFVPRGEAWQLSFGRDLIDSTMLRFAHGVVWFPVAYTIILIPVTIARLNSFAGNSIPFGITIFSDVVFNLTGLVNVVLLLNITHLFPDSSTLPEFSTQRNKRLTMSLWKSGGITPFTLTTSETAESYNRERHAATASRANSMRSIGSGDSMYTASASASRESVDSLGTVGSSKELIPKGGK